MNQKFIGSVLFVCYIAAGSAFASNSEIGIGEAARLGDFERLESLLADNANVNDKDANGKTPLHFASANGKTDCVEMLLKNGANINEKNNDGETPLHYASVNRKTDCIEILLKNGANINAKNDDDKTPLHFASYWKKATCVEKLLEYGADKNIKDNSGKTASERARAMGHIEIANLIDNYFDPLEIKEPGEDYCP